MKRLIATLGISLLAAGAQAGSLNLNSSPFPGLTLNRIKDIRADIPAPSSDVELAGPRVTLLLGAEQSNQRNPVWPGYSVFGQPILLYEAGVRSFLIAHPNPPAGYNAVLLSPQPVFEKQGAVPGLNFTFAFHFPVNGVDTFAYRYKTAGRPLQDVQTVVHERFHIYQRSAFAQRYGERGSEPDAEDLSLAALEQAALKSALLAAEPAGTSRFARQFLAVRSERYSRQPDCAAKENYEERLEGMARYVEQSLMSRPEVSGTPYDMIPYLSRALDMFPDIDSMDKSRYYTTGAAEGLLLDLAGRVEWKESVAAGSAVRDLLSLAYPLAPGEAGSVLAEAKAEHGYEKLLETGTQKATAFLAAKAAAVSAYESSPGIEWSVPSPRSLSFSAQSPNFKLGYTGTLMPKLEMFDASTEGFTLNFTDRPAILGPGAVRFHAAAAAVTLDGQPFTLSDGTYQFGTLLVAEAGLDLSVSSPGTLTVAGRKAEISYR